MHRMFGFLPPIGSYILAAGILMGTYFLQAEILAMDPEADVNKVWLVGGLIAFLLAFGGFQRSIELRSEAAQPRVSSADVLQKLTPTETGTLDMQLENAPAEIHGPDADSPLGRVRARSAPTLEHL
jgi:hypothetical protein